MKVGKLSRKKEVVSMFHFIFVILHIMAVLFGFIFLFATIPAHIIYAVISSKGKDD